MQESTETLIARCTPVNILGIATAMRRRRALNKTLREIRALPVCENWQRNVQPVR